VHDEIAINAGYPRDDAFRTSPDYAALCRQASDVLVEAINSKHGAAA
jgi:NitT/TauT family transport system ATP-binding protein